MPKRVEIDLLEGKKTPQGSASTSQGLKCTYQAFLLFENLDKSTWTKTLSDSRTAYTSLREHFLRDIEHPDDVSAIDPLTDDESVSYTASGL